MMTRGQDGLAMVFEESAQSLSFSNDAARLSQLKTISSSEEDLQAHQRILEQIQKESGGKCIWLTEATQ